VEAPNNGLFEVIFESTNALNDAKNSLGGASKDILQRKLDAALGAAGSAVGAITCIGGGGGGLNDSCFL